jgi:xanthine dehydrogenase accessory factor
MRKLKTLYCFGGGHVAVPTAHLAALVGFRLVVIDDRPDYANKERFPEADKVLVIKDFSRAFDGLEIDRDSYIVIVTRGHQYDRAVLEQALKTNAGYIGMISSRRKREAIYEYLMAHGVSKGQLEQVHSPIGIDIGGETPEEIAVSIAAELIKVRSRSAP